MQSPTEKRRPKLAVWDYPPAEFLLFGYTSGAVECPFDIVRADPATCAEWLKDVHVDVALVPAFSVLLDHDGYQVVPDIGYVSTANPYTRIFVKKSPDQVRRVAFNPRNAQEVLMARTILKEHYGANPEFAPYPEMQLESALEQCDAALMVGSDAPIQNADWLSLDLGQEWFELTAFPMVWGLFTGHATLLTVDLAKSLKESVNEAEKHYGVWTQAQEAPEVMRGFLEQSFRSRLDTYALEGLDIFAQHMFFYGALSEVPVLPFITVTDPTEADVDQEKGKDG